MKIKSIKLKDFKRFTDLTISDIPESAKLIVLLGPNGTGKSSLFDAFSCWISQSKGGINFDKHYHFKGNDKINITWSQLFNDIQIKFHNEPPNPSGGDLKAKKSFYLRSSYRNESDFNINEIRRMGEVIDDTRHPRLMINEDIRVSDNYQRIVSDTVAEIYKPGDDDLTKGQIREKIIGELRESMYRVFSDLILIGPGDPLSDGSFFFKKGAIDNFRYKNLSGGEKAAFDLLLDFILKSKYFNDTIFCIDEPELHMHTSIQANLLNEFFQSIPNNCQLWIATHSIGMMKKAKDLYENNHDGVVFLDFDDNNFDEKVIIIPSTPNRLFWKKTFKIAIGDIADLIAPKKIIFCEGGRSELGARRNTEFDAKCYRIIFGQEYPDVEFVSIGGTNDIEKYSVLLASILKELLEGIVILSLIDRDDRSKSEIEELKLSGTKVLSLRDIENYLWDDEILIKLCIENGKEEKIDEILKVKELAITKSVKEKNNPKDDYKSIGGQLYVDIKRILQLTQCGNTKEAFCINTLAPLLRSKTEIFQKLKKDIFD